MLLKLFQSAEARQPKTEAEAVSQAKSLAVRVRPRPPVALVSSEMSSLFLVMIWPEMVN